MLSKYEPAPHPQRLEEAYNAGVQDVQKKLQEKQMMNGSIQTAHDAGLNIGAEQGYNTGVEHGANAAAQQILGDAGLLAPEEPAQYGNPEDMKIQKQANNIVEAATQGDEHAQQVVGQTAQLMQVAELVQAAQQDPNAAQQLQQVPPEMIQHIQQDPGLTSIEPAYKLAAKIAMDEQRRVPQNDPVTQPQQAPVPQAGLA